MQNLNRDDRREMRRQMVNSLVLLLVVWGLSLIHISEPTRRS